ncbi:MAG: 4-hydroxy-tetrahydrodipicolinate reductase, partial [Usitatibacteraceae bacterium]
MATSPQLRIAIAGAGGRMGRALLEAVGGLPNAKVCAVFEHAASPLLGQDGGVLSSSAAGLVIRADVDAGLANVDV